MTSRRRTTKTATIIDENDAEDKLRQKKTTEKTFGRKVYRVVIVLATLLVLLITKYNRNNNNDNNGRNSSDLALSSSILTIDGTTAVTATEAAAAAIDVSSKENNNNNNNKDEQSPTQQGQYELYPFLVDATTVKTSSSAIKITNPFPSFPIVSRLENCTLSFAPSEKPKSQEEWRRIFWLPSFPGSGASNPSKKGDLLKQFIEVISIGDNHNNKHGKPVKDYHTSMRNKLKRCQGISETIGCTNGHPMVPVKPLDQTRIFRPEVIIAIRNPATAIPAFFTYKNIAYHKGSKQYSEDEWNSVRDSFFESTLLSYFDIIKFWRGAHNKNDYNNDKQKHYYRTVIYVPFEDIVTTDIIKGTTVVRNLTNVLRSGTTTGMIKTINVNGNDNDNNSKNNDYFETTTSEDDIECIWYRTAKSEWERQQQIIGDYIPSYTIKQQNMMVQNLTLFANEIENELQKQQNNKSSGNINSDSNLNDDDTADLALISLLRRYAYQIENYV